MKIKETFLVAVIRFLFGVTFLWAAVDKIFGLGFSTCRSGAEVIYMCSSAFAKGGNVTAGYLGSSNGPLADIFLKLAGQSWVNWAFLIMLVIAGVTLIFNKYTKIGAWVGAVLVLMMYASHFPPSTNPFVDDHLIYFFTLLLIGKKA